ncbi:zygote arrest 1, partial [Columba livia]
VLRQLPAGAAEGHPLPGQPQPDTAAPQGQHQGGGRAGEPAAGRLAPPGPARCCAAAPAPPPGRVPARPSRSRAAWPPPAPAPCASPAPSPSTRPWRPADLPPSWRSRFRQFCRTCQKSYNPYRVEDITCQSCKQTRCTCPVKMRHVDPKRPHRQDLCGRCKGKRLSCDSTFSFKYII